MDAKGDVNRGAVDVGFGEAFVGGLVVVVALGDVYFRAFERLVIEADAERRCPFAAEFAEFVAALEVDVQGFV